jgi:hypothetical protein
MEESMEENQTGDSKTANEEEKAIIEAMETNPEANLVEEAKRVAKEIKQGLAEREKIVAREEKLIARQEALKALGGGSAVGQKPEPHIETAKEYAERVMSGKMLKP